MYLTQYLNDPSRGWPRFVRTLRNRILFPPDKDATPYLAKFAVRSSTHARTSFGPEEDLRQLELSANLHLLDMYKQRTLDLLTRSAHLDQHSLLVQRLSPNHSAADRTFLRRLMTDASITIKPADKNLGMVLVDTVWYDRELTRMLQDTVTYRAFPPARQRQEATEQLQQTLFAQLTILIKRSEDSLSAWNPQLADMVIKYLRTAVTQRTCAVPEIYLLIKVHKASGLCGRPIVPSTRWLTTPASVVVDHLLQEVVRAANIAHIVKDTKSLVVELEQTVLPTRDGIFVTADIASLYTNIDTELGLRLVRLFLIEQEVNAVHSDLIGSLLTFVMCHSYLSFHGTVYHQIDGTAMGTAAAPTYANIVVYMLEKGTVMDMAHSIHLYRRFLDDVFVYMERDAAAEFMHRMNSLHPKLKFEFVCHPSEASFLDLRIHKSTRFHDRAVFDLSVHQKQMNLYLYIPFHSFHTEAMKRSFIQTELMRYIRNSSDRTDYSRIKQVFWQRLRDRGYPISFLQPLFADIFYADRAYFLWPAATLHLHPLLLTRPPISACLLRRLARRKQAEASGTDTATPPPVFVIPYTPLSAVIPTRSILSRFWAIMQSAAGTALQRPIIAYQSCSSLLKTLVYSRARQMEEQRQQRLRPNDGSGSDALPVRTKQTAITSYFARPNAQHASIVPMDTSD
jgi:hypothetical protein